MRKNEVVVIIIFVFLVSCSINKKTVIHEELIYSHDYDQNLPILYIQLTDTIEQQAFQAKYSKKAKRKGIAIVPLKVINQTDSSFIFSKDNIEVMADFEMVDVMENKEFYRLLKPKYVNSIPWFILGTWFLSSYFWSSYQTPKKYIISDERILIPYSVGCLNIAFLRHSNKKLLSYLDGIYINGKEIAPGDTTFGVFAIKNCSTSNILIRTKSEK